MRFTDINGDDVLRKRKLYKVVFPIVLIVSICLVLGLYSSKKLLTESFYEVALPKASEPIRIVHLTDLHNSEFGEDNSKLASRVAMQHPDLILLTGDLLNQDTERTDIATRLIEKLKDISSVYVSFGNHESGYERKYGKDLRALYTEAGATVLEFNWVDITVKSQKIRLGGLYGYCLSAEYKSEAQENESVFLEEFQDTDALTLLLCHMPVCWQAGGSLDSWNVDVVFAGHSHGGQVRIPGMGGLWAPDRGWFPGREQGLYWSKDGKKVLVLSRGLGNWDKLPQFNNIPEILVVDIVSK